MANTVFTIKYQDRCTNNEVLKCSEMISIETAICIHRLAWSGHVTRMTTSKLLRAILYNKLVNGKRHHGDPKRIFKDQVKSSLQAGISSKTQQTEAADSPSWRRGIHFGLCTLEKKKNEKEVLKKRRDKARSSSQDHHPPYHAINARD